MPTKDGYKTPVVPTGPLPNQRWETFCQLCLTHAKIDAYIIAYRLEEKGKPVKDKKYRIDVSTMATRLAKHVGKRTDYLRDQMITDVVTSSPAKIARMTADDVAGRLTAIATAELPGIIKWGRGGGHLELTLEDYERLTEQQRASIKSMRIGAPGDDGHQAVELVLHDPLKAMELIARHLGMFRDSIGHAGVMQINIDLGGPNQAAEQVVDVGIADVDD